MTGLILKPVFSWKKGPVNIFESRENFCFTFLYGIMASGKTWVQTAKWSTSSKIPDFQNGGKSPRPPISKAKSKFKCLQFINHWKKNFDRIYIVLRTKVQKRTHSRYFQMNVLGQSILPYL